MQDLKYGYIVSPTKLYATKEEAAKAYSDYMKTNYGSGSTGYTGVVYEAVGRVIEKSSYANLEEISV